MYYKNFIKNDIYDGWIRKIYRKNIGKISENIGKNIEEILKVPE